MRVGWRSPLGYIRGFRRSSQDRMSAQPGFILCRLSPLCCSVTFPAFGFALYTLSLYSADEPTLLCNILLTYFIPYMFTLHCQPLGCVLSTVYFILCRSTNSYIHYFLLSTFLGHYCFQVHPYTGSFFAHVDFISKFSRKHLLFNSSRCLFSKLFVCLCGYDASDHLFYTCCVLTVVLMPLTRTLVLVFLCILCVCVGPDPPEQLFYCCGYFSPTRLPSKWSGLSQTTHPLLANDGKWL